MDTKDIKDFYNTRLKSSEHNYEHNRWKKNSQARASFVATQVAVQRIARSVAGKKLRILEFGPGPGTWTKEFLATTPESTYTLVDISDEMLGQAKEALQQYSSIQFITSDILDFESDQTFDFFFSSRMIEYVPDKKIALQRVLATLDSGAQGYFITKTPQYNRFFSKRLYSAAHQNQISVTDFSLLLQELGCEVVSVSSVTSVFPGLRSGWCDRRLSLVCQHLPFFMVRFVSEAYVINFKKNN